MIEIIGEGNYNKDLVNELFHFTYAESSQEILEDCYLSKYTEFDDEILMAEKRNELYDYHEFMKEFFSNQTRKQIVIINKKENIIVSALRIIDLGNQRWLLEAVETALEYRQKGYGIELVKGMIKEVERNGGKYIYANISEKNIGSQKMHEKCGFVATENKATDEFEEIIKNNIRYEYIILPDVN